MEKSYLNKKKPLNYRHIPLINFRGFFLILKNMKKILDKYQFIIATGIILSLLIKDTLGAGIYSFEVTDKWLPFELTIALYVISIGLLTRHVYQKNVIPIASRLDLKKFAFTPETAAV